MKTPQCELHGYISEVSDWSLSFTAVAAGGVTGRVAPDRCTMGTALLAAPRASGVANNCSHTGRPGKRFVFAGRSGAPRPDPEIPLAFSFRGHGLTTLPWRLGNHPPLPCLRS